jgi:two-component system, OmpR family, KDP operon response regulator KdpE
MKTCDVKKTTHPILIIDDEVQIRRLLRVLLEQEGYKILEAENGRLGLHEIAHQRPELIILDLGLPDINGMEVLKRLREWSETPVLILSVRENVEEKVEALDLGADDYVTKPFEAGELLARLRGLLRRALKDHGSPVLSIGSLEVDLTNHETRVCGKIVSLTHTEFELLKILARYAGRVVTRRQILLSVWGPGSQEQSQYIRVYMTHLRRKLAQAGYDPENIRTEPGIGYRLLTVE